jgi:MFS transporter, DHA1 family, multidrug resistance protein
MMVTRNTEFRQNSSWMLPAAAGVVVFLYWAAQYVFVPVLPLMVQSKTTSLQLTGLALSIYGLGHLVIRIPTGILAGRLGRNKPLVLMGLLLLALGAVVMAFSSNIGQLILGRGITGIAAGTWVPLVLFFNKTFSAYDQVRATGLVTFISALARLSASGLSSVLPINSGMLMPFWISAGFAILAVLLLFTQRENQAVSTSLTFSSYSKLVLRKGVLFPSLLGMLAQHVNWGLTFGFLPILAQMLGANAKQVSSLVLIFFIFFVLGSLFTVVLGKTLGNRKMILVGFIVLAGGTFLAYIAHSMTLLMMVQGLIGFAVGICEPLLMAVSIQGLPTADQPAALGFHQTIYAVGMFSGPFLSGILASKFGFQNMFLITALTTLLLFIFWFRRI